MNRWPLYRRVLLTRALQRGAKRNMGPAARLALFTLLVRCGLRVSLVEIHNWTRAMQGRAYLWAIAFVAGQEDLPPPDFVVQCHHAGLRDEVRLAKGSIDEKEEERDPAQAAASRRT
jgi:hypothetical protein